jgi:uncharacterized ion transporter superfamily protein YfcC
MKGGSKMPQTATKQSTTKKSSNALKLKAKDPNKKKKGFRMWSAFSILMLIILVLILVSWILYWADVHTNIRTVTHWDPNTGEPDAWANVSTKIQAIGIVDWFIAPMQGFIDRASVLVFILLLGAFINLVVISKALEGFSQAIVRKLKGKEIWAIIPLMMFFSIAGSTEGMAEESLGFYMIMIPLMIAAGFDTFTGLLIVLVGAGAGVLASTVNPFVVAIAADNLGKDGTGAVMSVGDGLVWRLVSWVIITAVAIVFVMWYAHRVKKNPQKSITFATSEGDKKFFLANSTEKITMDWRKKTTLGIFAVIFVIMIVYLVGWDAIIKTTAMADAAEWMRNNIPYIAATIPGFGNGGLEIIAGFFLIGSIAVGMINLIGIKHEPGQTGETAFLKDFIAGASDILSVVLVIATAAGVGYVLSQSHMQELFVNGLASGIGGIGSGIGKVLVLYLVFLPLSFLIPSTSGFATAIFPLLTGVAQINGDGPWDPVVASGSITAFSFANGLLNFITPTSGVVMGAVAIARVDYGKFLKGMAPIMGIMFVTSIALLAIGGAIGGSIA